MSTTTNDDKNRDNEPKSAAHEAAEKFREEFSGEDPFADPKNVKRSYPNRVDQSGTPDTQPHQPKEALGEGQLSIDSVKAENEEVARLGEKKRDGKPGFAKVDAKDAEQADKKARPNAPENK